MRADDIDDLFPFPPGGTKRIFSTGGTKRNTFQFAREARKTIFSDRRDKNGYSRQITSFFPPRTFSIKAKKRKFAVRVFPNCFLYFTLLFPYSYYFASLSCASLSPHYRALCRRCFRRCELRTRFRRCLASDTRLSQQVDDRVADASESKRIRQVPTQSCSEIRACTEWQHETKASNKQHMKQYNDHQASK